ncbi:head maturation protease [Mycobacterium phage Aminay]|uniref:Capsid maturation protease n=1 Tax=Mycobacterium phage Aminay TaxID=2250291 RepID=A0A345KUZ4_9CAUD|nr:head maturation protease [Mycobacterium phage Aminay]AXH46846.1 capsid maturation protease [Mycobacterium phage Aminay]
MTQAVPEFQGVLGRLAIEAGGAASRLVTRMGGLTKAEGLGLITDAYPELVDQFASAAGELTAHWYGENMPRAVRRVKAKVFTPEPAALPARQQLAISGRWSMLQRNPATAIRGDVTRRVFDASRRTVDDNARREGVKWTRYASGNACGFCRMLATRSLTVGDGGSLYHSKATASRNAHRMDIRGHDHCKCLAIPVRAGYEPPAYVNDWLDDYNAVSRDENGVLLPEWTIADRMERAADERLGNVRRGRGRPKGSKDSAPRPPRADAGAKAASDAKAAQEAAAAAFRRDGAGRFVGDRHLFERNHEQAAAIARSARDRVATAQRVTARVDDYVATAARVSGNVKKVTDFADKTIGGAVPIVRDVKRVVDATNQTLTTASKVTGGANKAVTLADKTIKDTAQIAHGAKQLADEVTSVLDDVAYVALGARQLVAEVGGAARDAAAATKDLHGLRDLYSKANGAVETVTRLQNSGTDLYDRARGAVNTVNEIKAGVADIPDILRAPLDDVQKMAQAVRQAAGDAGQVADDAAGLAASVRALLDAVDDYRRYGPTENLDYSTAAAWVYSERVIDELGNIVGGSLTAPKAIEAVRPPTWVTSERYPLAPAPRRPELPAGGTAEVPAIADAVGVRELPAPPAMKALEAAPERPAAPAGPRALDAPPEMKALEAAPDPAPARPAARTLDDVEAELNAAIELGDDARIDELVAEMDKIEAAEKARQARNDAAKAKRAAARQAKADAAELEDRTRWDKVGQLVEEGMNPDEAEAEAFGITIDAVRRRNFMREAQRDGHHGDTFTKVLKQKYYSIAAEQYQAAEDATNGFMLKPKFEGKVDPADLWSMSDRDARKYMSDEMAAWFDEHGRITFMAFKQSVLDGSNIWRSPLGEDYLQ